MTCHRKPYAHADIVSGCKYSCFVLNDDCTWQQPTYRADRDMTETEFAERVLAEFGRHDFLVVGVSEDDACPDEDAQVFTLPETRHA